MVQVECCGCKTLLWANNAKVKGHCSLCMARIVLARGKPKGINARAWFSARSFVGER